MKTLKLRERDSDLQSTSRAQAGAAPLPGEVPALPLCLIDTQTLRTLKVGVDSKSIAAIPPVPGIAASTPAPVLALTTAEQTEGYDPYNNFGESVATRRPRLAVQGSRH